MTDLKPCPFCGAPNDYADPDSVYPVSKDFTLWNVTCTQGGTGCGAIMLGGSEQQAIDNWNARAESQEGEQ